MRSASKPVGGFSTGMCCSPAGRERHEADEAAGLVLQRAELSQVIHAVGGRFDMAEEHRAGAASSHAVPDAVNIQVFRGGFLTPGDGGADFLLEDFRAAACQGIEAGRLQFEQRFLDGFLCQPCEMENFDGGKAFQ